MARSVRSHTTGVRSMSTGAGRVAVIALGLVLIAAGCTAQGDGSPAASEGVPVIQVLGSPDAVALHIAHEEGLYEGVDVNVTRVGYGSQNNLFLAGDLSVTQGMAPWEVAQFVGEGEDFRFFSTAGGLNMWNGVVVRAEDASTYETVEDLVGQKLGIPGFGTGTWAAFAVMANSRYGIEDAETAYEIVTADAGALLALLESGEIEGALLFGSQMQTGFAHTDRFTPIFSFTQEWQAAEDQPMLISGLSARTSWLEENPDVARAIVAGVDRAVEWMAEHPEELVGEGKYADWFDAQGVLGDEATASAVLDLIESGDYYVSSDVYSDAWIDSQYEFISSGLGALVEVVPEKDEVFYRLDE